MASDGRARVLVFARAWVGDAGGVPAAYEQISTRLRSIPGLLGNELLRSAADPLNYIVMSDWETLDAFHRWEQSEAHRETTAPLRPYLTGASVFEVAAKF